MKVTVELDTSRGEDREALGRLFPALPSPAPAPVSGDVEVVEERGKAMTKAAQALGSAVGKGAAKLSPSEKARIAAKSRWAKKPKAAVPAKPAPKGPPERKPQDYSRAEEVQATTFLEVPGQEMNIPGMEPAPPFPDGRELLEGTFKLPPAPAANEAEGDEHVRSIEDIAREHDALP